MNKSEQREVTKITALHNTLEAMPFYHPDRASYISLIARSLATLVRSTRTNKARVELMALANSMNVAGHSDFIITKWSA